MSWAAEWARNLLSGAGTEAADAAEQDREPKRDASTVATETEQDRDEVKRKRLARFTAASARTPVTPGPEVEDSPSSPPADLAAGPAVTPREEASPVVAMPPARRPERLEVPPAAARREGSDASQSATEGDALTTQLSSSPNKSPRGLEGPMHVWAHDFVAHVFDMHYLKPDAYASSGRYPVCKHSAYLPQVLAELEAQASLEERRLVDTVVLERLNCALDHVRRSLPYLMDCYARADAGLRRMSKASRLRPVATEALSVITAYAKLILAEDDGLFPPDVQEPDNAQALLAAFLPQSGRDQPIALLGAVVAMCAGEDPEALDTIFSPLLQRLWQAMRAQTQLMEAIPYVRLLRILVTAGEAPKGQATPLGALLLRQANFNPPADNGRFFEYACFLGPFFRPTVLPDSLSPQFLLRAPHLPAPYNGEAYFPAAGPAGIPSKASIEMAEQSVHRGMSLLLKELTEVIKTLLRAPADRDTVFGFFTTALSLNAKRAHDVRFSQAPVCSDGFMLNVAATLLKLSEKLLVFGDTLQHRLAQVNARYLVAQGAAIDVTADTPLATSEEEAKTWREAEGPAELAPVDYTISRQFFHALHALHLGFTPVVDKIKLIVSHRLAHVRGAYEAARESGNMAALAEAQQEVVKAQRLMFTFTTAASHEEFLHTALQLHTFSAVWMSRMVDPERTGLLPAAAAIPMEYAALPQYLADDMAAFLLYLARTSSRVMDNNPAARHLVHYFVTVLNNSKMLTNPWLRGKIVEVLSHYAPERYGPGSSRFWQLLQSDAMAVRHLGPGLFQFYVDCENTDFYAKLSMRNNAQLILKDLWRNRNSRAGLVEATKRQEFVRFVMFLINDTTWCLLEARSVMQTIANLQQKLATGTFEGDETPESVGGRLRQAGGQTTGLLQLADETLNMFGYLTADAVVVRSFLCPELVSRLSSMLNSNLENLAGSKAEEIKVDNAEQFHYRPRRIMAQFAEIYLNCSNVLVAGGEPHAAFVEAMAGDPYYSRPTFEAALQHLEASHLPLNKVQGARRLAELVAVAAAQLQLEEEDLGEVPEEFLDPIMCTLMKDPVILPTSGKICDRSTMMSHLLSDQTDPFNREPLTPEKLEPATELRERILQWMAAQRSARRSAAA